jgi:phage major head subunit gpT-like protein
MPVTASHWASLNNAALREVFYLGYSDFGRRASMIPNLFDVIRSDKASELYASLGGLSTKAWNLNDTGRVQYEDPAKGFEKLFTHVSFAKGVMVQREQIDDAQTRITFDDALALGDSAWRKREKGAASVFNNAFTDSGVNDDGQAIAGPDGVGLCSTAHPGNAEGGASVSNEGTLAFSKANLGTARVAMMKTADDSGDIMDVMPNLILVPPELEDTAAEITMSTLDPTSANNAINTQRGRFSYLTWHYLTDTNAWFLIDSSVMKKFLKWFDRAPLEFGRDEDFETFMIKWRAYMRYSYGWTSWQWIVGHNPS